MRKMTYFVMALAVVLSFTQCKKEQPQQQNEGNIVTITLDVDGGGNNGSRVEVDPPHVTFESGDVIYVASNGAIVGTLTHNGSNFSGEITDPQESEPLYFYFLGNKAGAVAVGTTSCTVNISDQTTAAGLPVISMGKSTVDYSTSVSSYSSKLYNKCSLMKFNVTTPSEAAICITGMNNKVTVDFSDPSDSGFTYGKDGEGVIKMAGGSGSPATKWAIVLPQNALTTTGDAYSEDNAYIGTRPTLDAITSNQYLESGVAFTVNESAIIDLSTVTEDITVGNHRMLTGTLSGNYKISIADDATVTLNNATINGMNALGSDWAGLNPLGNATIILSGDNTVNGFYEDYPGIHIASGKTLIIQGTGSLTASSYGYGAGIGGVYWESCGNIEIQGGIINATGGEDAAGIGGAYACSCGAITITGGTITATGGDNAVGIGSGSSGNCGAITIESTVIKVTAMKGAGADYSIGASTDGTCGTVTIGGTVYPDGISDSPYTYPNP